MSFGGLILTNQGRNEIASAISNERALDFTHVQLGDGIYEGSYLSKTELTNKVMEIPVSRVMRKDNEVTIDCDWNCDQAPRGFYFREIGIIGNHALCYYDNAGAGDAEYIDPESVTVSKEKRLRFTLVVSDDVNITVRTVSNLYALEEEVRTALEEFDEKKVNMSVVDALDETIGQKADQTELQNHTNDGTIHFTSSERTKLTGIAAGANKYTHPASAAGAKASGLYKIATDASGHVTGTAAVTKADITKLGIPGQDTNTTYGTGNASVAGLTKLYTTRGSNINGTMTQKAITSAFDPPIFSSNINKNLVSMIDANGKTYSSNGSNMNIGSVATNILNSDYLDYSNSIYRVKVGGYYYIKGYIIYSEITQTYDAVKRFFVNIINPGTTTMKDRAIEIIGRFTTWEVSSQSNIMYLYPGEGLELLVQMDGGASGVYRAYARILPLFVS